MAKKKRSALRVLAPSPKEKKLSPAQIAARLTWQLKGDLKNAQIAYLRVAVKLARVRDEKMYVDLKHEDMEQYAKGELRLNRSSLYNYLRIRAWVSRSHPEWLQPKAKGFIPDLSDVGDLMWIESELARTNLTAARRAILEDLRKKGLAGKLLQSEVRKLRQRENTGEVGLKNLISSLRTARKRAAQLANLPPEAIQHLDAAIEILVNDKALRVARLVPMDPDGEKWRQKLIA